MSQLTEESRNLLFVFFQDDSGYFWIYDGDLYHRFLWDAESVRFIRSQSYLPKYSIGMCVQISAAQRRALEDEAARINIVIPFFDSEDECHDYHLSVHHDQMIFDHTEPGGFFFPDNGMKRSEENGGKSEM